jgi:hypothetical protein
MQEVLTRELRPKETEQPGACEKARTNPVDRALELPDCTLEELELRCNTETTVLKRILHFPLHA